MVPLLKKQSLAGPVAGSEPRVSKKAVFIPRTERRDTLTGSARLHTAAAAKKSTMTLVHDGHGLLNKRYKDIRTRWVEEGRRGKNKKR